MGLSKMDQSINSLKMSNDMALEVWVKNDIQDGGRKIEKACYMAWNSWSKPEMGNGMAVSTWNIVGKNLYKR